MNSLMENKNSSDPFWEQDLTNADINTLIIKILRFKPEWIYQICENPQRLKEEYGLREFFEKANVLKYIVKNFNRIPLKNFISDILADSHIY